MLQTIFHRGTDGQVTVERVQDVEPILDHNKALQNTPQKSEYFRHTASIPSIIIERWCIELGVNLLRMSGREFGELIQKKLRDPDWAWLRTDTPGTKYRNGARL